MPSHVVDMIEELKLRRWARLNHRRLTDPDDSLHPIILDELLAIQGENDFAELADSLAGESISDDSVSPVTSARRIDTALGRTTAGHPGASENALTNSEYFVHR